ncbi:transposable element Tcb2 transposase [Trichonephila clavipes]|nr:transposable element Tcb2 transposase [Trichonephila clavipes]
MSFTRRPGSGRPPDQSSRRLPHQRTAEGHLGSWRPLRVLPLKHKNRRLRLEWWRARRHWTAAEWNQVVFSDESGFNLGNDCNRVRLWRTHGEHLNPAFALQRRVVPTASWCDAMECHCLQYMVTVLIHGPMTDKWYVLDILQPHVLPLMQRLAGAIFQQDNARPLHSKGDIRMYPHWYYPSLACSISMFVSNRGYIGLFGMANGHPTSLNELQARLQ